MKKKREIRLFHVLIGVLLILSMHILYEGLFEDIIPHSRQLFWSHEAFVKEAAPTGFQKELPESAHDVKYYVYKGMLTNKSGYYVKLSAEDYENIKQMRYESYSDEEEMGGGYRYKGDSKKYVSLEVLEENRIDFLNKIVSVEGMNQYYFLCYYIHEGSDMYSYDGVICNDETCEMIEFEFYGPN